MQPKSTIMSSSDPFTPVMMAIPTGSAVAQATGSVIWNAEGHPEYQLTGAFRLEHNPTNGQYRVSICGTEVDDGPQLEVTIFFPTNVEWRKHKKVLHSRNAEGRGIGYVIKFGLPNNSRLQRIQFVFATRYIAFEKGLDNAVKAANE
jgi:hypothetical protein